MNTDACVLFLSHGKASLAYFARVLFMRESEKTLFAEFAMRLPRPSLNSVLASVMDGLGLDHSDYTALSIDDVPVGQRSLVVTLGPNVGTGRERSALAASGSLVTHRALSDLYLRHNGRITAAFYFEFAFEFAKVVPQLDDLIGERSDTTGRHSTIAVSSCSFRSELGTPRPLSAEDFGLMASARVGSVELSEQSSNPDHVDLLNRDEVTRIAELSRSFGVSIWSISLPILRGLAAFNETARRYAAEHVRHCLNLCSELSTARLIIRDDADYGEPAGLKVANDPTAVRDALGRSLDTLVGPAERLGVTIAFENGSLWFEERFSRAVQELEARPRATIGGSLNVGMMNLGFTPLPRMLRRGLDNVVSVTLNDNDGSRHQRLLPGSGTVDWVRVANLLAKLGYSGAFVYDVDAESADAARLLGKVTVAHLTFFGAEARAAAATR